MRNFKEANMKYTPEEKKRMDKLLEVFADFLAETTEFDVAYSEKSGFVRLVLAECSEAIFFPIFDFDDMLEMFYFDVVSDEVMAAFYRDESLTNKTFDYRIPHRRLFKIVSNLDEDREYALAKLDDFILKHMHDDTLP